MGGISKPGEPKEGGVFIPQAPLVRTSAVSLPRRLKLFLAALSSGRGSSVSQLQDWWWTRFLPGSPALAHSPSTDYPQPHHPRALPHFSWTLDGWSLLGLFHFPHHTTFSEASVPQRSHCPSVVCSPQDIAWDSFPPEAGMIADKPMSSKCTEPPESPALRLSPFHALDSWTGAFFPAHSWGCLIMERGLRRRWVPDERNSSGSDLRDETTSKFPSRSYREVRHCPGNVSGRTGGARGRTGWDAENSSACVCIQMSLGVCVCINRAINTHTSDSFLNACHPNRNQLCAQRPS